MPTNGELLLAQEFGNPASNVFTEGLSTFADAAYDMGLFPGFNGIAHTAGTLTIEMTASGDGFQGGNDESWAIDNFEIILNGVAPIPEPSTMLLLGSGLAGLAFFRSRRKDRKKPINS